MHCNLCTAAQPFPYWRNTLSSMARPIFFDTLSNFIIKEFFLFAYLFLHMKDFCKVLEPYIEKNVFIV